VLKFFLQGFTLGLAYVAPIGMQNIYVINTAIGKNRLRAYQVALITVFFDISLALACFFGMGAIMEKSQLLRGAILLIGSLAIIYIGIGLLRSTPNIDREVDIDKTIVQVIAACFMVTWINPQALIDGSLLLGGFRASLPQEGSAIFILGVCLASFTWFTGLTTIVSIFRQKFNKNIIKGINVVCGVIIIYYGLRLGYNFLQMI
jgi:L-lysine exporter family protein LysE/ArgO